MQLQHTAPQFLVCSEAGCVCVCVYVCGNNLRLLHACCTCAIPALIWNKQWVTDNSRPTETNTYELTLKYSWWLIFLLDFPQTQTVNPTKSFFHSITITDLACAHLQSVINRSCFFLKKFVRCQHNGAEHSGPVSAETKAKSFPDCTLMVAIWGNLLGSVCAVCAFFVWLQFHSQNKCKNAKRLSSPTRLYVCSCFLLHS